MSDDTPSLCERCGAPLPPDARFCAQCGAPVTAMITQERKVVTVLFADLSASTELAIRLDPERFREVMGAFFRMVSEELESLRGRAEKFIGDAVMAVFGIPHAHEDDALRAVRASLIIRERVTRLGTELGLAEPLQVHVGITSGPVATGSGPSDQLLVSGPAVTLAARLQEAAETGEILVDETTRQLTETAVGFGEPRAITARGFDEPVTAWPVVSLSVRSSRRTIPMVDRRRELALLTDTFERVRETSRAHLITVLGEPGIGKSRLVEEFLAGLDEEVKVLRGHASEFEEDPTFAPLAEMVQRELGLEEEATPDAVRARLREVVEACCDPTEVDQVVARLGMAIGLADEAIEGHRYRAAEIRAGFLTFLEGLTQLHPAVLVFEDMSMAHPALLELIEGLAKQARRLPLLLLCVGRDWMLEIRPGWGGGLPDAVTLRLEPLSHAEAIDLVDAAGEGIDRESAERIAIQTGGNPFFIVETTGMLLHEDLRHGASPLRSPLMPPSVRAVVASRIDHLDDAAKELVRRASVFARSTFTEEELALVAEPNRELLEMLEEEELLVGDPDRAGTWRFRHDLLRAVAYESLPKRELLRLHLQVAEELAREDRHPQMVAYHLEQAAKASLDLQPDDRDIAEQAVEALRRAGHQARRRMESRTAIDLYRRALALAGPRERWGEREAEILAEIGESLYWLGEFDQAADALNQALELGGDDPWTRAYAYRFLGDITLNAKGDPETAGALFDRALAAARELDDPYALARTLLMAGWAPYWRGDLDGARALFEEALQVARGNARGDRWAVARALTSLTSVISPVGDEKKSLALGQEALEIGREMKDPFTIAVASENVGNSLRRMWRLDEAIQHFDESVRVFRELDARWELAAALGDRGNAYRLTGRLEEADADLEWALDLCRRLRERSLIAWTVSELALIRLLRGDPASTREILELPDGAPSAADPGSEVSLLRVRAILHLAEGDPDAARQLALRALELNRADGWPNPMAAAVWWTGTLFGSQTVGGDRALADARARLEEVSWISNIREPELLRQAIGQLAGAVERVEG